MEMLRSFATLIKKKRRDLLLIVLWTAAMSVVFIKTHQQFYTDHPALTYYQIGYSDYLSPRPTELDLALMAIISAAICIFLSSMKGVVFGYFASMILSCTTTVVYVFIFNWYALDLGRIFVELPFGWEWVLFQAIINTFRYIFPLGFMFSLIGVVVGTVFKVFADRD